MKKILLLSFVLAACMSTNDHVREYFIYIKDPRTNLCFVTYELGTTAAAMSQVPCTPEVEAAIQADAVKASNK